MTQLDILAALKKKIADDRANVWQRVKDYYASINNSEQLKNILELDGYTEFYAADYGLILTDFKYQTKDPVFTPDIVRQTEFENNGDGTAQQSFGFTKAEQDTFSFGFKEGLKVGLKATVKTGIPRIAEGKVEVSGEISFEANQQKTFTSTKTWVLNETVNIPAHSSIRITGFIQQAAISADFTGVVKATEGLVLTWFKVKTGGYTEWPIPLTVLLTEDQRTYTVSGSFSGAEGVSAYTKVDPISTSRTSTGSLIVTDRRF